MAITIETISANRYAPQGSEAVNLYSNGLDGGSGLTLAQIVIAVSLRSAAAYEAQGVIKMNMMSDGSGMLDKASKYMEELSDETMDDWTTARRYLVDVLHIDAEDLPETVDTYKRRIQAVDTIKAKVDALTQQQQSYMIDLQTLVNRRDVAYATSSNMVRTLGTSMSSDAANFI